MLAKQLTISSFVITFLSVSFCWTWSQCAAVGKFLDAKMWTVKPYKAVRKLPKRVDVAPNRTNNYDSCAYMKTVHIHAKSTRTSFNDLCFQTLQQRETNPSRNLDKEIWHAVGCSPKHNKMIKPLYRFENNCHKKILQLKGPKIPDNHVYVFK